MFGDDAQHTPTVFPAVKGQKHLDGVAEHLEPGETIVAFVPGLYDAKKSSGKHDCNGTLIATDRRVVFFGKRLGGFQMESYPYTAISSADQSKQPMFGHTVTLHASGNRVYVRLIKDTDKLNDFMTAVRSKMHGRSETVPATVAGPDPHEQLRKLAELRDAGILSDEEFDAKKQEILGRM